MNYSFHAIPTAATVLVASSEGSRDNITRNSNNVNGSSSNLLTSSYWTNSLVPSVQLLLHPTTAFLSTATTRAIAAPPLASSLAPVHPSLLQALQQSRLYRPGAPIYSLDQQQQTQHHDPGIQQHDVLLPWHLEQHQTWPGNQQLERVILSDPSLSMTQMLAYLMEHLPHIRLFTRVPLVSASSGVVGELGGGLQQQRQLSTLSSSTVTLDGSSNLWTQTHTMLPPFCYCVVPQAHVRQELLNMILQFRMSVSSSEPSTTSLTLPRQRQSSVSSVKVVVKDNVETSPTKVTTGKAATGKATKKPLPTTQSPSAAPKATAKSSVSPKTITKSSTTPKIITKAKNLPKLTTKATHKATTTTPTTTTDENSPLLPVFKSINKPMSIKLKKSNVIIPQPIIHKPTDLLDLYSTPMFSFTLPEKLPEARRFKRTTPTHSHVSTESSPPKRLKMDSTFKMKRKTTASTTITTTPSRSRIPSNSPPRKVLDTPDTPDPIDRSTHLPKGITQRNTGKWQAQVYIAGASRYVGVYNTSHQANTAYAAFKSFMKPHKRDILEGKLRWKELHSLMDEGRKYAASQVDLLDDTIDSREKVDCTKTKKNLKIK